MKFQLNLSRLVVASMVLLHAGAGMAGHGAQDFYFAEAGTAPGPDGAITTLATTSGSQFTVDLVYSDDNGGRGAASVAIHWDSDVLEYVSITQLNQGGAVRPAPADPRFMAGGECTVGSETTDCVPNAAGDGSIDDGDANTDRLVGTTWAAFLGDVFDAVPVRLLTVTFEWKSSATENSTMINLTSPAGTGTGGSASAFAGSPKQVFQALAVSIPFDGKPGTPRVTRVTGAVSTFTIAWDAPSPIGCATNFATCITQYDVEWVAADVAGTPPVATVPGSPTWVDAVPGPAAGSATTFTHNDDAVMGGDARCYRVAATPRGTAADKSDFSTPRCAIAVSRNITVTLSVAPNEIRETDGMQRVTYTIAASSDDGSDAYDVTLDLAIPAAGTATPIAPGTAIRGGDQNNFTGDEDYAIVGMNMMPVAATMDVIAQISGTTASSGGNRSGTVDVYVVPRDDGIPDADEVITTTATNSVVTGGALMGTIGDVTITLTEGNQEEIDHVVLPEVARAIADQAMSAIARRIEQATSGEGGASMNLAGQTTLADIVTTNAKTLADGGTYSLKQVLGKSDFVLPLNAVGGGGMASTVTVWGSGNYRDIGGEDGTLKWDGELFGAQLGVDGRLHRDVLAGVALSWSDGEFDFRDPKNLNGKYTLNVTSVLPYASWTTWGGKLGLWAGGGYGTGELDTTQEGRETFSRDIELYTVGVGANGQVYESEVTTVRVKAEVLQTLMDVDSTLASGGVDALDVEAWRMRVTAELGQTHPLANGAVLEPRIEVGMRHDTGDGQTGTGAEIGGGLRYSVPERGFTLEANGRVLAAHGGDYDDWGVTGGVRFEPGSGGQGFSLSLEPSYGNADSRVSQLWSQENVKTLETASGSMRGGQVNMAVGYGVGWRQALFTPYGNVTLGEASSRTYSIGTKMQLGEQVDLSLEGSRKESATEVTDQGVLLNLDLGF